MRNTLPDSVTEWQSGFVLNSENSEDSQKEDRVPEQTKKSKQRGFR